MNFWQQCPEHGFHLEGTHIIYYWKQCQFISCEWMNGKEALGCRQYIPCKYQIMSQAETHINLICKIFCFTNRSWGMQLIFFFVMILTHTYADYPALKAVLSEKGLRDGKFFTSTWKSLHWLHLYIIFTLSQPCWQR